MRSAFNLFFPLILCSHHFLYERAMCSLEKYHLRITIIIIIIYFATSEKVKYHSKALDNKANITNQFDATFSYKMFFAPCNRNAAH